MIFLRAILSFIICLGIWTSGYADTFPRGCEVRGFSYDGRFLVLNETGEQSLYLIQNRYYKTIELRRLENPNVFMSPPLIARLDQENWAAFASDIKELNFECFIAKPKIEVDKADVASIKPPLEQIDCREVLDVCQYPRVKFALSNMGNYWVSTNKKQSEIIHDAAGKGILLRW